MEGKANVRTTAGREATCTLKSGAEADRAKLRAETYVSDARSTAAGVVDFLSHPIGWMATAGDMYSNTVIVKAGTDWPVHLTCKGTKVANMRLHAIQATEIKHTRE